MFRLGTGNDLGIAYRWYDFGVKSSKVLRLQELCTPLSAKSLVTVCMGMIINHNMCQCITYVQSLSLQTHQMVLPILHCTEKPAQIIKARGGNNHHEIKSYFTGIFYSVRKAFSHSRQMQGTVKEVNKGKGKGMTFVCASSETHHF